MQRFYIPEKKENFAKRETPKESSLGRTPRLGLPLKLENENMIPNHTVGRKNK